MAVNLPGSAATTAAEIATVTAKPSSQIQTTKEPAAPAVPNKKATPDSVYRYKQATQKTIETSTDDATVSAGGFKPMSPLASVLKLF